MNIRPTEQNFFDTDFGENEKNPLSNERTQQKLLKKMSDLQSKKGPSPEQIEHGTATTKPTLVTLRLVITNTAAKALHLSR